jgi:hypothetical protein
MDKDLIENVLNKPTKIIIEISTICQPGKTDSLIEAIVGVETSYNSKHPLYRIKGYNEVVLKALDAIKEKIKALSSDACTCEECAGKNAEELSSRDILKILGFTPNELDSIEEELITQSKNGSEGFLNTLVELLKKHGKNELVTEILSSDKFARYFRKRSKEHERTKGFDLDDFREFIKGSDRTRNSDSN